MRLAVTGHRPNKILANGKDAYDASVYAGLVQFACSRLEAEAPQLVITGMAQGWDFAIATACLDSGIPYIAAVPFKGQEARWPEKAKRNYFRLLSGAKEIRTVNPGDFALWKLHARNHWMVDNSDRLLALWDGSQGGTSACVEYAHSKGKPVMNVMPAWERFIKTPAKAPTEVA